MPENLNYVTIFLKIQTDYFTEKQADYFSTKILTDGPSLLTKDEDEKERRKQIKKVTEEKKEKHLTKKD